MLLTGAAGDVGRTLAEGLAAHVDLVLTDADPESGLDVLDVRDLDACTQAFDGVDTVVHLAGAASPQSDWDSVLDLNIVGTRTVLEAAVRAGVRRVVLASSNHVTGMYDKEGSWPVYASMPPRPDSLYGVSKAVAETLGRYYHDAHGLEVVALRIGWSTGDYGAAQEELLRAMWLSERDTVEVFRCAIEAPVSFGIYYATSDNPNRRWDLTGATVDLGYRPQDSWQAAAGEEEDVVPGGEPTSPRWPDV
ncbi:NAD-dependent epimerase/dehydratase family protein [Ornithinimicrobium tianjinense]|uniref:NAD-dependent epimerase n=1 Tax=Ornithinimicrobium tianjinense TaxID=1195761 RepID=A0A917BSD4_9MICO|nr:NAD(P)-dependent oxidoreductase [Ornithinimicrobium tianjinense]GGF56982.1 NAD-dependent epimerase [Ornithinimicrobium tianjinense]